MTHEWQTRRLGELARLRKGVSYKGAFLDEPGPRLLGLGVVVPGGGLRLDAARTYAGPHKAWQRLEPGEMFIALTDLTQDGRVLGSPARLSSSAEGEFLVSHHVARVELTRPDLLDTRFLYYLLQSTGARNYMRGVAIGTTVRAVSVQDAEAFAAAIPTLKEQRAIAARLGALDDKIDVNRRVADSLERIARALFKSWFADFDPVRGTSTVPDDIRRLFPDKLVDSPLGPAPEGWVVGKVSDLASTQYGYTASATQEKVGPHLLRVKDINKKSWIDWSTVPYCEVDPAAATKYSLQRGDVVVARMADPGKAAIVDEDVEAVFASYLVRLGTPSPEHSLYLFYLLTSQLYAEYVSGAVQGSVQKSMNAKVIAAAPCVLPPGPLLNAFASVVGPIRRLLASLVVECTTLVELRDSLLPKLISGEVRLGAAGDASPDELEAAPAAP